ncbi:MAG TPA: uracil-DNA glycosylase [Dehalococcoidia bacterium]|nr:uracil-DNA glycosylase [Dehalococcoidia bacterium]
MTELQALHEQIKGCLDCALCKTRTHAVPGEGPADARIMFVGEGPGFHEDQQARPFVGAAGRFLDQLIASAGLRRQDVYITNVIKCRPPQNRDPLPAEIESCRKHLEQQIELIHPKLIVTLGRYSLAWFFPKDILSRTHGQLKAYGDAYLMPMYHPAAALHAGNMRSVIEEDFRKLPEALARSDQRPKQEQAAARAQESVEQMRLF